MALETQLVGIDFTGGLDTQADERLVVPGKLLTLINGTLTEKNSIKRRDAWSTYVSGTTLNGLALYNNELLTVNGSALSSYSSQPDAQLVSRGVISNCTLTKQQVERNQNQQDEFDIATNGSLTCYVWRESNGAGTARTGQVMVRDEATGTVLLGPSQLISTVNVTCMRVLATSSSFLVLYADATTLYARVIAFSAPGTLGAQTSLRTDFLAAANPNFDCCLTGTVPCVAYPTNDATNSLHAITIAISGTTPSVADGPTAIVTAADMTLSAADGIACAAFSATRWGVYFANDGTGGGALAAGLYGAVLSSAAAIVVARANLNAGAAPTGASHVTAVLGSNGTTMNVYSDNYTAAAGLTYIFLTQTNVANAVLATNNTWQPCAQRANGPSGPFIAGKAFLINSAVYLPVYMREVGTGTLQNLWMLLDSSAKVMARALYGTYAPNLTTMSPPSSVALSASTVAIPVGEKTLLSFSSGANVSLAGYSRLTLSFPTATPPMRAQLGGNTFFAGASLSAYDSLQASEAVFHYFPEVLSVANGGAGAILAGTYQYVALYEWIDGAGQRHQSAPSPAVSYTAPGGAQAVVTIPTLLVGVRGAASTSLVVYRTKASGTTFYRLTSVAAPVANSVAAATVNYTDDALDTAIGGNEILYTNSGALPNNAPPACSILCVHQNRLFINSEDPYEFRYSQPFVSGFGLQWSELLVGRVPADTGKIVAFGSQDDRLVIWTERAIYVVTGTGPTVTGGLNGYSSPQRLASDIGCLEPRAVLATPLGFIFQARKGFHLLTRGLEVQYIGEGAETFASAVITSAVLLDDRHECRFSVPSSSNLLVYSYETKQRQWSVFDNYAARDAVYWPGAGQIGAYVHATATALRFDAGNGAAGDDGATGIVVTAQTAWLHLGAVVSGFQRVRKILLAGATTTGDTGAGTLAVTEYWDGTYADNETVTVSDCTALVTGTAWDFEWRLPVQKSSAITFYIVNTPPNGSNGGLDFSSLTLEVGRKRGGHKLPSTKRR